MKMIGIRTFETESTKIGRFRFPRKMLHTAMMCFPFSNFPVILKISETTSMVKKDIST